MAITTYDLPNWSAQILLITQSCLLYFNNLMKLLSKLLNEFFVMEASMVQRLQKILFINIFEVLKLIKPQIFKFL